MRAERERWRQIREKMGGRRNSSADSWPLKSQSLPVHPSFTRNVFLFLFFLHFVSQASCFLLCSLPWQEICPSLFEQLHTFSSSLQLLIISTHNFFLISSLSTSFVHFVLQTAKFWTNRAEWSAGLWVKPCFHDLVMDMSISRSNSGAQWPDEGPRENLERLIDGWIEGDRRRTRCIGTLYILWL